MGSSRIMTIRDAVHSDGVEYRDLYEYLQEKCYGDWDSINSTDSIVEYCRDMMKQGVAVSHIVTALEQNEHETDDWKIWLGNSMETPEAIYDKVELVESLSLSEEELDAPYGDVEEDEDAD